MPARPPIRDKTVPAAGSSPLPGKTKAATVAGGDTVIAVLLAISFGHLFNDVMQSMLPAVYPLLQANYHLSLLQIGLITAGFQITGSVLQPLIGFYTDKKPLPYSLPFSALFTMAGLLALAFAGHYWGLLAGACLVGFGSSIFHPEAARVARFASGGRFGFAQSVFQVGGNSGTALGPLLAALFINRQYDVGYFALIAFAGFLLLTIIARWYAARLRRILAKGAPPALPDLSKTHIRRTIFMLVALMTAKYIYLSSMSNFYTFFAMEKYGLTVHQAQYLLFLYLGGIAAGTIFGGPIGDKIGARRVIWFSILGVLPFTLALPHASLPLMAVLSVIIGLILASAFPAIVVFAQELMPGKIGTIAGLFYGLSFGIGALSSALLGALGDKIGNQALFDLCAFLPLLGIIALFLPRLPSEERHRRPA
ncbi:MAG: MFS transporter [Candidatus Tokpelaia sp.]|nr:MAG: MFS transporter [Candidatus Tokpelaia sp.]KAA6206919.1 MAG: MFS transporter [Candidatus Tokpelaia sp.]